LFPCAVHNKYQTETLELTWNVFFRCVVFVLKSINKGHDIFGRRDDFTKARTKLPLKIPNEGSLETMQKIRNEIRQELQKEMDLKMNEMMKQLLDVIGQKKNTIQNNGFGRSHSQGSIGRSGTAKGSLRYQAKVALAMKKAKDNAEAHYVSSAARKKQRKLQQEQATSRLVGRLQLRRKKLDKKNVVVVPKVKTPEDELRNEIRNLLN
jgi:hypothetical protein